MVALHAVDRKLSVKDGKLLSDADGVDCCCGPLPFLSCGKLNAAGCAACPLQFSVDVAPFDFISGGFPNPCSFPGMVFCLERFFDSCQWRCCEIFAGDHCWCEAEPSCLAGSCRFGLLDISCTSTVPAVPASWAFTLELDSPLSGEFARYAPVPNPGLVPCPPPGTWEKYLDTTGAQDFPPNSVVVA